MANFYVSTSSGGTNSGTLANPWTSITTLNANMTSINAGDSVLFKKGDVFTGTLLITRSGTSGNLITFGAYGTGSNPIISGGTTLSSWTSLGGNLYEASLPSNPKIVTINNIQYAPGRYPNSGWLTIDATNGTNITSTGLSGQTGLAGASVVIRKNRSIIDKVPIESHSGNTIGFTNSNSNASYSEVNSGFGFFLTNKFSFLDTHGDWFWNSSTKKFQIYFVGNISTVIVSTISQLVVIQNKSNITFSGLDFSHADDDFVQLEDANNISFNNCNFTFSGKDMLGVGGTTNKNINITNCNITNINNDAAHIYGGDNDGLKIQNNTFTNIGHIVGEGKNGWGSYSGIIMEGNACTNANISYNRFQNIGYSCIQGGATNSLVKNNVIINSCMYADDGAAIYVQEGNGIGKRITGNIIIDVGIGVEAGSGQPASNNQAKGIYCDASNAFTEIDNNTITGADDGVYIDDSHDINVHHNTIYNNGQGIAVDYLGNYQITNLNINNNIIVQNDVSSNCFAPQNQRAGSSIGTWGQINNNIYARPLNQGKVIYSWSGNGPANNYTISEWNTVYGFDANSKGSPIIVNNSSKIRFEYNDTNTPKTINLGALYINMDGVTQPQTITLQPYTSIVLLQTGGTLPPSDIIPPTVNIISPINGSTIQDKTTFITEESDNIGITHTDLYYGNTLIFQDYTPPPAYIEWDTTLVPNGIYNITAKSYDAAGNIGSASISVTVANSVVIPNLPPTANAGLDKVITLPINSVTLVGVGNDPDGTIVSYEWKNQSGVIIGTTPTVIVNNLIAGTYIYTFKVTDNQGATSSDTVQVTVKSAIVTPPTLFLTIHVYTDKTVSTAKSINKSKTLLTDVKVYSDGSISK